MPDRFAGDAEHRRQMSEQTDGRAPLERQVGRFGHILPTEAKPGDECPWCAPSLHTGVFDLATGKHIVCKVCGDKGVIDDLSIDYYGTPK